MMGRSHLIVGGAGFLAFGATAMSELGAPLNGAQLAAGAVVAAGASMLPDVDHPQATVAQSLGPVTHVLSKVVSKLFGGHRNGTHSLLFAALVTIGLTAWLSATGGPWVSFGILFFFSSLLVRTLTEAHGLVCAAVSAIVAATVIAVAPGENWIPWAVGIGCLLHMAGDLLTPEGVPPFWPVSKVRISLPIVGHTGDWREKTICAASGLLACYLLAMSVYLPLWNARQKPSPAATARTSDRNQAASVSRTAAKPGHGEPVRPRTAQLDWPPNTLATTS
jgi:membrane-bound metal-dependent hydrolase YbcI (DUF457 family)